DDDILRRHGQPFLDTYRHYTTLCSLHDKALRVYAQGRRPLTQQRQQQQEEEEEENTLTQNEMYEIMRFSRLLHFCRAPFLLFESNKDDQQRKSDGPTTKEWYRTLLHHFVVKYSEYLEKLDLQLVQFKSDEKDEDDTISPDDTSHLILSSFDIGGGQTIDFPSTYLLKVFDIGSIICEVRFIRTFVSVSLYGLPRELSNTGCASSPMETIERARFKVFEESMGQLKHWIHIHSFVYDFHIYYLQQLLTELDDHVSLPTGIHLLATLDHFCPYYTSAQYASNRLFSGVYELKQQSDQMDLSIFFKYLFNEASQYGVTRIMEGNTCVAVTTSSSSSSDVSYTLILCPMEQSTTIGQSSTESSMPQTVLLRYFLLVVYPFDMMDQDAT
ncbi:uncharacterized protein BX664DRAFT_244295, partial [Halteromyces radiatus]|uniref:uncharacterized protein n=1 Tax=Halteromyces radiatus TaxID=101107 RepID=UPI00221EF873